MGYQARLADGAVIAPAVEVLSGELKPQQANARYRGTTGTCPHCEALRRSHLGTDNATLQAALSAADLTVHYRSAQLADDRMLRIMHFAHRPGFLRSDGACLLCRSADLAHHAAVVEVIGRWARKHWTGATVTAEMTVVLPGTPPQQFRPDVVVQDADGKPVACIEYQRTPEAFVDFVARHELRCRQFPTVLWFFGPGAYGRSGQHRTYLHERGHEFYRCCLEPDTARLQYQAGKVPERQDEKPVDHRVDECSVASLVRALEDRQEEPVRRDAEPLRVNTALDMQLVPERRTGGAQRRIVAAGARPAGVVRVPARGGIRTVAERVQAAIAAGCVGVGDIRAWDAARERTSLHFSEIQRTLRRLPALPL